MALVSGFVSLQETTQAITLSSTGVTLSPILGKARPLSKGAVGCERPVPMVMSRYVG